MRTRLRRRTRRHLRQLAVAAIVAPPLFGLLAARSAHAQLASPAGATPRPFSVILGVGAGVPTGLLQHSGDTGLAGSVGVQWQPASSPFGLRVDGMYDGSGVHAGYLNSLSDAADGRASVAGASADLTARIPPAHLGRLTLAPYAMGGVGVYERTVEVYNAALVEGVGFDPFYGYYPAAYAAEVPGTTNRQTAFGWNAGGGLAVPFGRVSGFVEARYIDIGTSGRHSELVPLTFGVRL